MLSLLSTIFGLKRSIGTGLAIAALLVAAGPYIKKLTGTQQPAMQTAQPAMQNNNGLPHQFQHGNSQFSGQQPPAAEEAGALDGSLKVLELDEEGFNWRTDWWKYLLMVTVIVCLAYMTLKITNLLFKTAIVTLCIVAGLVGSLITAPFITPPLAKLLQGKLPAFLAPSYLAYAICFLVCYLIVTAITNAVSKKKKKEESND